MKHMFKGIAEGMIGMGSLLIGGAIIAPIILKVIITSHEIINPTEPLFKLTKNKK